MVYSFWKLYTTIELKDFLAYFASTLRSRRKKPTFADIEWTRFASTGHFISKLCSPIAPNCDIMSHDMAMPMVDGEAKLGVAMACAGRFEKL